MKHLFLFVVLISPLIFSAQNNSIGFSYGLRQFPLSNVNSSSEKYAKNLPENVFKLTYRSHTKKNEKIAFNICPTYSFSEYRIIKTWNETYGSKSSNTSTNYKHSSLYSYSFLGLELGFTKISNPQERFSFGMGLTVSINHLIDERTYSKENTWNSRYSQTIYSGVVPVSQSSSTSTGTGSSEEVQDRHTTPINAKLEIPFIFQWNFKKSSFQFTVALGCSSKSRDAIYHGYRPFNVQEEVNLYIAPQLTYFFATNKTLRKNRASDK